MFLLCGVVTDISLLESSIINYVVYNRVLSTMWNKRWKKDWVGGNWFDRKACLERGRFVCSDRYGKWATSFYWGKSGTSPRVIFILGFLKSAFQCILSYQGKKITFVYPHLFVPLKKLFLVFEWPASMTTKRRFYPVAGTSGEPCIWVGFWIVRL